MNSTFENSYMFLKSPRSTLLLLQGINLVTFFNEAPHSSKKKVGTFNLLILKKRDVEYLLLSV